MTDIQQQAEDWLKCADFADLDYHECSVALVRALLTALQAETNKRLDMAKLLARIGIGLEVDEWIDAKVKLEAAEASLARVQQERDELERQAKNLMLQAHDALVAQKAADAARIALGQELETYRQREKDGFEGGGWICEEHPERQWPHDECAGPGQLESTQVTALVYQRDQARTELAALGQEVEQRWQPIDTYVDPDEHDSRRRNVLVVVDIVGRDVVGEARLHDDGWYWANESSGDYHAEQIHPTHWMDLPASPAVLRARGSGGG